MKTLIGAALIAASTLATPVLASHDRRDAGIDGRQHELAQRIERGWRAGELTPREYRGLVHEAREIERAEHFYRADGRLSPGERGTSTRVSIVSPAPSITSGATSSSARVL